MQQQGPDANALEKYSKRLLIVFLILTVRARPRAAQMPRILRTFRRAQGTYAIYILAAIITMAVEDTLELMLDVLGAIIFIFCCAGVLLAGRHSLRNKDKNMMLFFILYNACCFLLGVVGVFFEFFSVLYTFGDDDDVRAAPARRARAAAHPSPHRPQAAPYRGMAIVSFLAAIVCTVAVAANAGLGYSASQTPSFNIRHVPPATTAAVVQPGTPGAPASIAVPVYAMAPGTYAAQPPPPQAAAYAQYPSPAPAPVGGGVYPQQPTTGGVYAKVQ